MAGFFHLWSTTAADNDDIDSTINWAEGQLPSTVNNSARSLMAALASWDDDNNGTLTTAGAANAYTIASPNIAYPTLVSGITLTFKANHTNTSSATLAVNSLTAKSIRTSRDTVLVGGEIRNGGWYHVIYNTAANSSNGGWVMLNEDPFVFGTTLTPSATGIDIGSATSRFGNLFLDDAKKIDFANGDVTITHATNSLQFAGATGYTFDSPVAPSVSNSYALGVPNVAEWADLYMGSGATIGFNNGDVVLTHASNFLNLTGGSFYCDGEIIADGDAGGAAGANTLTGGSDLTANSSGIGTILFKGATNRNSDGFIKFYIGTTAYYVPCFSTITG
jgi:hypothetical protein